MAVDARLLSNLEYNLGPVVMEALHDPQVIEVLLNSDGNLWVERLDDKLRVMGQMAPAQGQLVINLVASALETVVTAKSPIVEGELPLDGSRFEGAIPPVCMAPTFSIRKKAVKIFNLSDYVENGIMPAFLVDVFSEALQTKKNILVVGGTGSGKTTFVNALIRQLSELCPDDRLVIIEDTMELQSLSKNTQFLRTSDDVDMHRLLRMTMRMRPDRILIGEVRDGAALALLKAWNTGHPGGIATVHADAAEEGLYRIGELIEEATLAPKQRLIARAVGLTVYIEKVAGTGRRITQVMAVTGYDSTTQQYITNPIYNLEVE